MSDGDQDEISVNEAAQEGQLETLQRLVHEGKGTLSQRDSAGWTPLLSAARSGRVECLRWILAQPRVDVNHHDTVCEKSALILAAYAADFPCVRALVEAGADVDYKDGLGFTALDMVASHNDVPEIAEFLRAHSSANKQAAATAAGSVETAE